jgi:hypothetical protein
LPGTRHAVHHYDAIPVCLLRNAHLTAQYAIASRMMPTGIHINTNGALVSFSASKPCCPGSAWSLRIYDLLHRLARIHTTPSRHILYQCAILAESAECSCTISSLIVWCIRCVGKECCLSTRYSALQHRAGFNLEEIVSKAFAYIINLKWWRHGRVESGRT